MSANVHSPASFKIAASGGRVVDFSSIIVDRSNDKVALISMDGLNYDIFSSVSGRDDRG